MADTAPSGTVWGSIAGGYGRIGIYATTSSTDTQTTVTVQVWFWSKYSVSDNMGNDLCLDNLSASGSATTSKGGTNIQTTVDIGSGWSTSNQKLLTGKSYTYTHNRGTSATTRYIYAKLTGVNRVGATMYASTTVSIPALASYTVSYNASGGSGAPSSQKKWHGTSITLSSSIPTRSGYDFNRWLSSTQSQYYDPGDFYGHDESTTMVAQWKAKTYTVAYNANGGSGAPANQTKTYGVTLTLSSTKPTRENYNFHGWATSTSATSATYAAGGSYTTNATVTLYAVWELAYTKPRITGFSLSRCDSTGNVTDDGTYALVKFSWATDKNVSSIVCSWVSGSDDKGTVTITASGTSGSVSQCIGGSLSTDSTYTITVTIKDEAGNSTITETLNSSAFAVDFLAGGKGVTFGKAAEQEGFHCAWDANFEKGLSVGKIPVGKRCIVGNNSSSDTNPYYKFASVTASDLNEDIRISFKVTFSYGTSTRFGTLNALIRTENANGANAVQRLEFESDTGLDASNFWMACSPGKGIGSEYQLWVKLTAYRFCHLEVLSESSRIGFINKWKLYNQISAGFADVPELSDLFSATKPYLLNFYPIGSVVVRYDSTSPANLFGGTWTRIEGRMLYGCASSGTVGATGTHTTGSGSSSLPYVNVAIWRRTA